MAELQSSDSPFLTQEAPRCPVPVHEELARLSARLGQLVNALGNGNPFLVPEHASEEDDEDEDPPVSRGEYRTYYLSPHTLKFERMILKRHRAKDICDVALSGCALLEMQSRFLSLMECDATVSGFHIQIFGELLGDIGRKIHDAAEVFMDMEPVDTPDGLKDDQD